MNISAALRTLAGALTKMANGIRWLSSGPRAGIGEIRIPANEPGSSMMPGKANATQAEALAMVAAHVFGNDATVAFAGTQGNFQLNTYKPVMLHNTLDSIDLLADASASFHDRCLTGLALDRARIAEHADANLMVVAALTRHIGYDRAADIAHTAQPDSRSIRDVATSTGHVPSDRYDQWVDPLAMPRPHQTARQAPSGPPRRGSIDGTRP